MHLGSASLETVASILLSDGRDRQDGDEEFRLTLDQLMRAERDEGIVSPCHERAVRADHPRLVPDPGWPPLDVARITARVSAALRSPPGTEWA